MKHPLTNPSLAPFGFAFPLSKERLKHKPAFETSINCECVIAGLWEDRNQMNSRRPLPIQTIVHEILPAQAKVNRITTGDFEFDGLPYLSRDILVLSGIVQWFATNCGECFLTADISKTSGYHPEREFLLKFAKEKREHMIAHWTHVCNKKCVRNGQGHLLGDPHFYDYGLIMSRDRALVDGLMRWLGKREGRKFIEDYISTRDRKYSAAHNRFRAKIRSKAA